MRGLMITGGLLLIWQLFVILADLPAYILPSPLMVGKVIIQQFPLLLSQSIPTLAETLLGLAGALCLGCLTALGMAYIEPLRHWLKPVLLISQALPTFALAPLFVIWLGYGMSAKIAVTTLMLFFPIASSFFDGLTRTEPALLDLARIMRASRFQTLLRIRLPAAIPSLVTGIRVAAAGAPMGAVIGEWVGASKGLGFLMLNANARMQIDVMFAALVFLILWSLLLYFSVDFLLKKYVNWQKEYTQYY
jgi:putative hydroxymethylpyrimidine transport system permease protein